jgi:hypothetical protein
MRGVHRRRDVQASAGGRVCGALGKGTAVLQAVVSRDRLRDGEHQQQPSHGPRLPTNPPHIADKARRTTGCGLKIVSPVFNHFVRQLGTPTGRGLLKGLSKRTRVSRV